MRSSIVFVAALGVLAGPAVFAHTELTASTPTDKAVLDHAPKELTLSFSEAAKLTALSIQKQGGSEQDLGPLPAKMQARFSVAAPALTAGHYMIRWRALSDDGHVASGEIGFEVKAMMPEAAH
jgi:methionine-rich copper-binding protein CopC